MRNTLHSLALCGLTSLLITACTKEVKETTTGELSSSELAQIAGLGFSTDGAQRTGDGYLVEGDIVLTAAGLRSSPTSTNLVIAREEQYRTFNMVTNHPTITIGLNNNSPDHDKAFSAALDEAIRRYNDVADMQLTFQRTSSGADITVVAYYEKSSTLGSAGFPSSSGEPYNQVRMNTYHYSKGIDQTNIDYIATIMAHEIGHCIGFRHTDYMSRRSSCGYGGNEGQAKNGIGAVHIPGTPTGPDEASWMLACIGNNVNRPFNANDIIALKTVY